MYRPLSVLVVVSTVAAFAAAVTPQADQIPVGWYASHMKPIGYSALDGRGGAFKMSIKRAGDRWYLYVAQLWTPGWTILDVTDPANPTVANFIKGPENTAAVQIDVHDNIMITGLQAAPPSWGGDPKKPHQEGVLIWDVSDPVHPKQLSHWETGAGGTHRNGYPGGRYANLAASLPGFRGLSLAFLDITDPANPQLAGHWWMPGQKVGEEPARTDLVFHGPATMTADGKKAYLGYGDSIVILDTADVAQPKLIGQLRVRPPFDEEIPAHDVTLIPGRNLLFVHAETTDEGDEVGGPTGCNQALSLAGLVDISNETKPKLISMLPVPMPPAGVPYTSFCDRGGRFGPHNTNLLQHNPDVEKQADLIYLSYFTAGLRIFDIKDSHVPKEVGWFLPPTPTKRYGPVPADRLQSSTEDVLVDTRGNIYITDKQWGVFILKYTGNGEPAPTAR